MNDTKISALPAAAALHGSDVLPGVQADANVAITPAQIVDYVLADPATDHALQGAAGLLHPGYVSGLSYCPPFITAPSGVAVTADTLYAIPIPIARACTINAIGFRVMTSAAGSARFGIYSNATGPDAKIAEGATAPSTGASVSSELALAMPTTLTPGLYWLAAIFSAAPSIQSTGASEHNFSWMIGVPGTYGSVNSQSGGVVASAAMPFADGLPARFGASQPSQRVPLLTVTIA